MPDWTSESPTIVRLEQLEREIWGRKRMTFAEIVVAMGVVYGDICRQARWDQERGQHDSLELAKELGNMILSTIRWCDDLGFWPETCLQIALDAQRRYQEGERNKYGNPGVLPEAAAPF